jgi:PAS domain S-box-containing protein
MQEKNFNRLVLGLTGVFGILFGMFYIVIIRYFLKSMTGFKKILNEMGTHIFIADAETHQIQFMNDAMKEQYGLDDTVIGKRCWEALQTGLTEPCAFCPIPKLISQAQGSLIWEEYNTKTNRYYKNTSSIIIWGPIKRAYLQHSVDIHELKAVETTLTKRLQQEELLSAISQSFISTKELPVIINNALGLIGIFMNVSKVVLARLNKETSMLEYEYEWYNEAQQLSKLSKRLYLFSPGGILYDTFISQGKQYLVCNDIEAYPDFKQVFSPLGIKAFISVPIVIQGEFWGVLGIDECIAPHQWDESDIQFSQLVANAIAGTIIRVVAEKQLLRMSSIVDSTPQYVSYFNASGHFEYINQGVCTISGYSSEELMRHGMDLLFDEETRSFIHEIFIPTVLERGAHQTEVPLIRKDGEQRILSFSSFTVGVKKEGIGGIATDITELRQLESALIAAKERAEQSNTAKSNFLSRMSHEMRTPMNAIIGMTAIAQTSYSQKKIEYCLTKINEASVHLLGVINDILDMSKIEAGKFELSPSEFNLEKLLLRVTNVMNFRIAEKRQDFIVYMDQRLPNYIIADEQRLAQIITNLLSNAVKFTPEEGTVVLSVKQTAQEGGGCTIQCSVSDTGIGISTEQQGRLFSLFEQADGSIARKYGGTGLGLAISKNILDLMGGSIEVVSALGKGATFTFEIKVETGKGKEKEKEILTPKTGWEGLRILAVDDSPEVLDYIREFVQTYGIHFYGASDGEEAYQLLEAASREFGETPFDLVFVDWRMPRINGIELTKKIKARFGPNLVVIMISAAEWAGIEEEAKAAGLDGFLPKPLFPSVIADCINSYFHIVPFEREEVKAAYITQDIFAGHCILLAEDVEINREIVLDLLEPTGITIDTAENGKQAIKMFEEEPEKYRLILMDIHMPEMDGFEAARLIRELPTKAAQEIPIVAMTANVFREDIEKCLAAGMNDHLGKPIDIEELMKKLKYYLLPSLP